MTKRLMTILMLAVLCMAAGAQVIDPVRFSSELKPDGHGAAELVFTATIDDGWHVYSTRLNDAGPIEAELVVNSSDGVELVGTLMPRGKEIEQYEELFGATVKYFEKRAQFVQKVKFTKPRYALDCYLQYGVCNDQMCLPPQEAPFQSAGEAPVAAAKEDAATKDDSPVQETAAMTAAAEQAALPEGDTTAVDTMATAAVMTAGEMASGDWPQPVADELRALGGSTATDLSQRSLWSIFLLGFVGGLLALVMPWIWPIIPMTVSFFLKRAKDDRRRGIRDACTYGVSIVVIYLLLGLVVTALFGPSTLNDLSTNAVFNIFLFLLLVVFALSFFGWFEIKLPAKWANAVDTRASNTSGILSIFLMAFTLVLVSFSCTAPIIGLLLVDAVTSGNIIGPTVGMFGFALALALPFTLFALFPSWLKQAPKSGSWMNTIKVVLGFIELAFAMKFFSVADLAYGWHLMDREVFLSLWIAIFTLLALYLMGLLKFQSDMIGEQKPMPVVCVMGGLVSLAFAIYMVPGLWGAPCKAVSAFAPPMNTQDFNLNTHVVEARYTDYYEGMAAARREGKPVLLDFTGFGCVNCRKMEAAVWTDPRVADRLRNDYVLVSLFVDDKTPLAEPITVDLGNGRSRTLRTIGDKWSYLQATVYGANTQPFYVAVDADNRPLAPAHSYKEDIPEYLDFLVQGLRNMKQQ